MGLAMGRGKNGTTLTPGHLLPKCFFLPLPPMHCYSGSRSLKCKRRALISESMEEKISAVCVIFYNSHTKIM
jgi:hypothetical protein